MNVERLLPADPVRPIWSSSSALVYTGGLVVLFATFALIGIAQDDGGDWALIGAALVACVVSLAAAEALMRAERMIAAGVAAFLAATFAGTAVAAVLDAIGALEISLEDYQPASLLVEAAFVAAGIAAVRRYRSPLPTLLVAAAIWIAITDLGSLVSWNEAGELLSIGAGAVLAVAGLAIDRAGRPAYAFWPHAVGGVAAGGGIVAMAGDSAWPLIAALAVGYVALAFVWQRSSYAVLGAVGVLIATTMFAVDPGAVVGGFIPFDGESDGDTLAGWQIALSYLVAGLLLAAIGVAGRLWRLPRSGPVAAGE